jgi:uncharacterized protein (DUF1778 family)
MHQFSLRVDDELGDAVKAAAADRGQSVNAFVVSVLSAVTDPAHAGDDAARLRERLARAGILSVQSPPHPPRARPDRAAFEAARARAGQGTPLSELVAAERDTR